MQLSGEYHQWEISMLQDRYSSRALRDVLACYSDKKVFAVLVQLPVLLVAVQCC